MEEFSQSRGDDDLFDDEIIPIEPSKSNSTAPPTEEIAQKLQTTSINDTNDTSTGESQVAPQRGRGGRGRVRGPFEERRTVGGPHSARKPRGGGIADSRYAPKPSPQAQTSVQDTSTSDAITTDAVQENPDSAPTPTGPATKPHAPAVRGDRSRTGGPTRSKLTEQELSEKMAAAKQRSQDLAAAHARAQADKESFDERERVARVRRENEEKRRREMEGERESNRQRKMAGLAKGGGREWDQGKVEQDGSEWEERARERQRGREEGADLQEYLWQDGERGRGRGRGGRGRGRGRGDRERGRGEFANGGSQRLDVGAEQDFPALPSGPRPTNAPAPALPAEMKPMDESTAKVASWADQVETEGPQEVKW
jgi:hypothetical protein